MTMQTYPLRQMTMDEAITAQFRLVDLMHRHFNGYEALEAGDYGIPRDLGRPRFTARVEAVLADFFEAEDCSLVPAAGTGGIRSAFISMLSPGASVLFHSAPLYPTTKVTCRAMGLNVIQADFNDAEAVDRALAQHPDMVYVQHTRQLFADRYDPTAIVARARELTPDSLIMVDDNYAAMQTPKIGIQFGADLSTFSLFKLLGEPGVGCILGKAPLIQQIRTDNYSGGTKIQGPIAVSTLKHLVYAPVALAIHTQVVQEVVDRLNAGEVRGVHRAYVGNHAERVILVEFDRPISKQVTSEAWKFGAAPYPVGSSSQYEINAMFYRVSGIMSQGDPELVDRVIRINPYRTGPDTIIRVLDSTLRALEAELEKVAVS